MLFAESQEKDGDNFFKVSKNLLKSFRLELAEDVGVETEW